MDDGTARSLIEKQLRGIHPDVENVRCDDGEAVMTLDSGEEMVRTEFKSNSETYRLLKLFEDTCHEGN